jgi:hypothetical protein
MYNSEEPTSHKTQPVPIMNTINAIYCGSHIKYTNKQGG